MEEEGVPKLCLVVSGARDDSLCAMYFGVSCAFYALKYWSQQALDDQKCVETRDKMLQGSAQLLGMLVWRMQKEVNSIEKCELLKKLKTAEREISELKKIRSEDAKANDRVASIYAAQEQSWFAERRRFQQQIGGLLTKLRFLDKQKNDTISELNGKLYEMELSMKSKYKTLEEEEKKRKEAEEKLKCAEAALEELKETTKREAQDHSNELLKHKTAFIELVSNQRQLEAELGRALRQVEAAKQQLGFVFEEKEQAVSMVRQLSLKVEKMHVDSGQKHKLLSAMMRKSKLDSTDKQMFLKDVKLSKPKRKKAEAETKRWRTSSGSRNGRHTWRNMLARRVSSRFDFYPTEREVKSFDMGLSDVNTTRAEDNDYVFDNLVGEVLKEHQECSAHLGPSLPQESTEFDKATRLDEWVHSGAEKYHHAVEQRHQLELDAFAEQMQLKEDKLEAYRRKLRSAELETKRLQSQIEGLNQDMSQLRHNKLKLEALLLDREVELKIAKDRIALQLNTLRTQKTKLHMSKPELLVADDTVWSKVSFTKKKPADNEQPVKKNSLTTEAKKEEQTESVSIDTSTSISSVEEKDALVHPLPACAESSSQVCATNGNEVAAKLCLNKRDKSPWKGDLHALGVSYKIKRLSQQLIMLDRLTGVQESGEINGNDEHGFLKMKGFLFLISLLKKQVSRYQSLQERTDDLSQRMGDKDLHVKQGVPGSTRSREETEALEHFLEETFQLQRFIVATGQKLMEIQSKLASGFVGISEQFNGSASFDMKRFADTIQSLFKDVQRGMEVRIARIIGGLEGTLACDGIRS